jgi:hypothetical protein
MKWEGANVFYGNEAKDMGMQGTQSLCDSDVTICHRKAAQTSPPVPVA